MPSEHEHEIDPKGLAFIFLRVGGQRTHNTRCNEQHCEIAGATHGAGVSSCFPRSTKRNKCILGNSVFKRKYLSNAEKLESSGQEQYFGNFRWKRVVSLRNSRKQRRLAPSLCNAQIGTPVRVALIFSSSERIHDFVLSVVSRVFLVSREIATLRSLTNNLR